MANIKLYRGGTPVVNFLWHENDAPEFKPPFSAQPVGGTHGGLFSLSPDSPPYNSHAEAAMNKGNFVLGFPLYPVGVGMTWQEKLLAGAEADDIIQCIWVPEDHFATFLNLKSIRADANMAGATVALVAQKATFDPDAREFVYTEDPDFAAAVTAQAGTNVFDLSGTFNAFVSLFKTSGDYAVPMYSDPTLPPASATGSVTFGNYYIFGLKILSVPTDQAVSLAQMRKGVYLSLRMEAFECPTNL